MADRVEYINSERAAKLVAQYLPMFRELNEKGIEYCVVGGLGVLLHAHLKPRVLRIIRICER